MVVSTHAVPHARHTGGRLLYQSPGDCDIVSVEIHVNRTLGEATTHSIDRAFPRLVGRRSREIFIGVTG